MSHAEESTNAPAIGTEENTNAPASRFARVALGVRVGDEEQEYRVDGLIPLWSSEDSRLFLEAGGSLLEDEEQEVNVGILGRHLFSGCGVIVGASMEYDAQWTENDNQFDQAGCGLELMSRWVDASIHYSYPLTDRKWISDRAQSETHVHTEAGQTISTTASTVFRTYEEALEGYDGEVGLWAPFLETTVPTALYVGYFDYESEDNADFSGMRARIESRVLPQLTFDVGWQELTDEDADEVYVGVRLYLPWDIWNGWRTERAAEDASEDTPLRLRLDEIPRRIYRMRTETTTMIKDQTNESVVLDDGKPVCTVAIDSNGAVVVTCK